MPSTKYRLFRRRGTYYLEDKTTGRQTSLRTKNKQEAQTLLASHNEAQRQTLLNLRRLPGRVTAEQGAWLLGFESHDIPVLIRANLLQPLGDPAHNGPKLFSTQVVLERSADPTWLHKAIRIIQQTWKATNSQRIKSLEDSSA